MTKRERLFLLVHLFSISYLKNVYKDLKDLTANYCTLVTDL